MEDLRQRLLTQFEETEVNDYFIELSKVSNITKNSFEKSRELITLSNNYSNTDKLKMLKMLDVLYSNKNKILKTSDYENKVYCQMFLKIFSFLERKFIFNK